MVTGAAPYTNALRPRITIKTVDGADTLYTYDSFDSNHDINIGHVEMENAVGETGTFNIMIQDHNNVIPKDNIHSVKVFLELGKTQASYQHFLIGYGDIFSVDRARTNSQLYFLDGFGSKLWAYQLYISRKETYKKDESDAKVYNILDNALTKRLWRPLKKADRSISDITGYLNDGISTKVNTPFTVMNKSFAYFGDLCDELCDITGAVWFIDYSSGLEVFTLCYKPELEVPVLLKSGDLADKVNDDPLTTSYIKSAFKVEDNTTTESGTATRLFTTTISDETQIYEQDIKTGATTLDNRWIGQQFIVDNDTRRIVSMEIRLEKIGEPESPNSRVNGAIVLDNGSNKPSTSDDNKLDEFHIDLGSIRHESDFIKVDLDIKAKELDVAQSKIWVILEDRSGIDGKPQSDPDNTVKWFHNNVFSSPTPLAYYSATAPAQEDPANISWTSTNTGPLYTLRVNSNIRRVFARTNTKAAKLIRLREQFIPTDFLKEPIDVMRYLSLNLSQSSKGRRGIADFRVTVPDNFLFRPYQSVGFTDGLSDITDTLQVQRARYICSTSEEDPQIGTLHAELTLSGLYNTLVGACTCV